MAMAQYEDFMLPERGRNGRAAARPGQIPYVRIACIAVAAVLLCAGFVGQRVFLMNLTYRLEAESARVRQLAQENEFLQLQIARARSLDRIEAVARGRLGMVPAERRDVVVIPDGGPSDSLPTAVAAAPARGTPARGSSGSGGWLAALLHWANDRWPGRTAVEAGSPPSP